MSVVAACQGRRGEPRYRATWASINSLHRSEHDSPLACVVGNHMSLRTSGLYEKIPPLRGP
jgi:hypothetical protein